MSRGGGTPREETVRGNESRSMSYTRYLHFCGFLRKYFLVRGLFTRVKAVEMCSQAYHDRFLWAHTLSCRRQLRRCRFSYWVFTRYDRRTDRSVRRSYRVNTQLCGGCPHSMRAKTTNGRTIKIMSSDIRPALVLLFISGIILKACYVYLVLQYLYLERENGRLLNK